jgi:glucose-1-phosphate thymidylyltransferase
VQARPEGLAQAYILGADFVGNESSALILGDNLYFGHGLAQDLQRAAARTAGATIFGYWVKNPNSYGVVELDDYGKAISIEEKPPKAKSNYAVTGLYFYDNRAAAFARTIKPSARGELEITALNMMYLEAGSLNVELLGRGYAWLDTGTHETLLQAGEFVRTIEERQGLKIGCPEEVAYRMGFIDQETLLKLATPLEKSGYGIYLQQLARARGPTHRQLSQ